MNTIPTKFPEPIKPCQEFITEMNNLKISTSDLGIERLMRSHGQSFCDVWRLRFGESTRIPDFIVWPKCHNDVVAIVKLATKFNYVLTPFGGGTAITGSVTCPKNEKRLIISLDTSQMNKLLWLDREKCTACFESGIVGQDLERVLNEYGLTLGHEPDSCEFSTLGGWVSTKASGMKKNIYGNIEDLVVHVRFVTPSGVLERNGLAPRVSGGPDFDRIVIGSEGTLGVVTEVVVKIRPKPTVKTYGSLVFPNFEKGVCFVKEVARKRLQPASIRLIDNAQFTLGQSLKPENSWMEAILDPIKRYVLTDIKKIDLTEMVVTTLTFEGEADEVKKHTKLLTKMAEKYDGFSAGSSNGLRGYVMTYVIAYVRDAAMEYGIACDAFEISVSWESCDIVYKSTIAEIKRVFKEHNSTHNFASVRLTQSYDAGCCLYFYFAFNFLRLKASAIDVVDEILHRARDQAMKLGSSSSHHHGVGKLRKRWYKHSVSEVGVNLYKSTKKTLDPRNIFALNNIIDYAEEEGEDEDELKAKL